MRSYLLPFLFTLTLISCSSNDDEIDCSVIDIAPEIFFIEYVDNEGNNLLENGTYLPEEVKVTVDGEIVGEVYDNTEKTFLIIYEQGALQRNDSDYLIILSSTETDVMQLEYSEKQGICSNIVYTAESVVYNGKEIPIEDTYGNQKITVVKQK